MNRNQRIREIINIIKLKKFINIKELTKNLLVSEMTIRRDLSQLAHDNILELIPGGAILKQPDEAKDDDMKYLVTHAESQRIREKMKIGQKAASLLEKHDTIILDIGSTIEYLAKFMKEDIPVTILCNSLNTLVELYRKENCNLLFAGGYFHKNTLMFESQEGIDFIKRTRADKAYLAAAGVHPQLGITTVYSYELETKKAILNSCKTKILLVDSSKFGKTKAVYFADLSDFDVIITDDGISAEDIEVIEKLNISLMVV